jgi:hypothetical protein
MNDAVDAVVEVETDEIPLADNEDTSGVMFEYSIKIVNPVWMSEFKNVRVCKWMCCQKLEELRGFLGVKVPPIEIDGHKPNFKTVDVGYIEPGHGMKGKKQWLLTDADVEEMYKKHFGKSSILLWAYACVHPTKTKHNRRVDSTYAEHKDSLDDANEKFEELRNKHGDKYTLEQLKMWAEYIPWESTLQLMKHLISHIGEVVDIKTPMCRCH